jgi:hypothetical protein
MDDDTIDAAYHQQELEQRQRQEAEGWLWWPSYHKALCERQKAERDSLQATERAVREWIRSA